MSTELNLGNLKKIRQELTKAINFVREKVNDAFDLGEISRQEWQQAKDGWGELETIESELQALINGKELDFILDTNIESPRSQILQATNQLENAAQKIDDFGNLLSEIAKISNILTNIINATQTGGILVV